jgi:hypothetical protein
VIGVGKGKSNLTVSVQVPFDIIANCGPPHNLTAVSLLVNSCSRDDHKIEKSG